MLDASKFSAIENLPNGQRVEIRSLQGNDAPGLVAAIKRSSSQSIYRRFFAMKRDFSEREVEYFVRIDFVDQVALVASIEEEGRHAIVAGGRYVLCGPSEAELAFFVVDQYQSLGIGSLLMRHLIGIARQAGLKMLVANILPDNASMLRLVHKSGLPVQVTTADGCLRAALHLQSQPKASTTRS